MFSRYHYLSEAVPGGLVHWYGLYEGDNQIGIVCFANYVPTRKRMMPILHVNRLVIHPDYCGLGLGIKFTNACAKIERKLGYRIMCKMSSMSLYKHMVRSVEWVQRDSGMFTSVGGVGGNMLRDTGFRNGVKWWSFEYVCRPQ